ncbi:MAG: selenocysteine-specific translation elongation factor [Deltaproteobacteria bacterium]|nr:selenocysteine-specific translation elongation factor [Deltaproteobacteria bacterium]
MNNTSDIIIGTAGHIDHGKTTLVRALTGVDCDRLDEEKQRGITIVLGFAPLDLPSGRRVGVIDVPGHERFVRTMVSGAGGVDVGLLVVAADEGVMPQTREHLDILTLLEVPELLVALNRIDAVDEELAELAELDVRDLLEGSPWEDALVLPVSGLTGEGVPELRAALDEAADRVPARSLSDVFRMPVDRAFSIRGFGTVVTGTTRDGELSSGSTVEVLPGRERVKVRGIQVHGSAADAVGSGQRVALNLQGVSSDSVPVGAWLATPNALACSDQVDVQVTLLASAPRPLPNNSRARLLCGTAEVLATVRLMADDGGPAPEALEPGETSFAQLALVEPLSAVAGDRFVLRSESPLITLGGGTIIDPEPPLLKRRSRPAAAKLHRALVDAEADDASRIRALLQRHTGDALDLPALQRRLPMGTRSIRDVADAIPEAAALRTEPRSWTWGGETARWVESSTSFVGRHHEEHPLLDGPLLSELRQALVPVPESRLFEALLPLLSADAGLDRRGPRIALAGHEAAPDEAGARALDALVRRLAEGGVHPPPLSEAMAGLELPPDALAWLVDTGELLRVTEDFLVARAPFAELVAKIAAHIEAHGPMGPVDFKELSGLTRRFAMPFLEFLDRQQVTVRKGNGRTLHDRASEWLSPGVG